MVNKASRAASIASFNWIDSKEPGEHAVCDCQVGWRPEPKGSSCYDVIRAEMKGIQRRQVFGGWSPSVEESNYLPHSWGAACLSQSQVSSYDWERPCNCIVWRPQWRQRAQTTNGGFSLFFFFWRANHFGNPIDLLRAAALWLVVLMESISQVKTAVLLWKGVISSEIVFRLILHCKHQAVRPRRSHLGWGLLPHRLVKGEQSGSLQMRDQYLTLISVCYGQSIQFLSPRAALLLSLGFFWWVNKGKTTLK